MLDAGRNRQDPVDEQVLHLGVRFDSIAYCAVASGSPWVRRLCCATQQLPQVPTPVPPRLPRWHRPASWQAGCPAHPVLTTLPLCCRASAGLGLRETSTTQCWTSSARWVGGWCGEGWGGLVLGSEGGGGGKRGTKSCWTSWQGRAGRYLSRAPPPTQRLLGVYTDTGLCRHALLATCPSRRPSSHCGPTRCCRWVGGLMGGRVSAADCAPRSSFCINCRLPPLHFRLSCYTQNAV